MDLHCHLRGTMLPMLAVQLAKKNGINLPINSNCNHYSFTGFKNFLDLYDQIGGVVQTASDLMEIAFQYMKAVSLQGTIYVEFMISPMHSIENGISFETQISAITDAIEKAESELGVNGCIIITCVRHRGPDEAMAVAKLVASHQSRYIRGFGLTGNENCFAIEKFQDAFNLAENIGLGLTAHAGEWLSAESVLSAVNILNLSRVGHGISIVESPEIMAELAERKIGFEVCLSSNVWLGASDDINLHPAKRMLDTGCSVTFSTDDPAYFDTTPKKEMQLAIKHLNISDVTQRKCFTDGIKMAFCNNVIKAKMLSVL